MRDDHKRKEYDDAVLWCAKQGLSGIPGRFPALLGSELMADILASPDAFMQRVRETASTLRDKGTMKTETEVQAKLETLQEKPGESTDYAAGVLDGACGALGWALGYAKTVEEV